MTINSLDLTSFPIWNQSVVPCPVLTVASWPAYQISQVGCDSRGCKESDTTEWLNWTEKVHGNLLGMLESYQVGVELKHAFQMQKTKALNWLFPENVRRVEKQSTKAGRFLLGYVLRNLQRGPWNLSTPCVCQLSSSWPSFFTLMKDSKHKWQGSPKITETRFSNSLVSGFQVFVGNTSSCQTKKTSTGHHV